MGYAQLVIGPAGSGKVTSNSITLYTYVIVFSETIINRFFLCYLQSTYCSSLYQHCEATRRTIHIVNLDPAAENFDYPVAMGKWALLFLVLLAVLTKVYDYQYYLE